jgi:transcriptional regulator with XRE-family HTH domain
MLANRITQLRRVMSLNQLQLAQKLSISPSALGMYKQSRRTLA